MTKIETEFVWPKPIPGWDLMKWKDETQAAILRETAGMTDVEVRAYFQKASEELHAEQLCPTFPRSDSHDSTAFQA